MDATKPDKLHVSLFGRYTWQGPDLLVVRGNFAEVLTCRDLYNQHHGIAAQEAVAAAALDRLMAAAGLAAVSLTDRESWGWSLALEDAGVGLFCGMEPEGMVCGQVRATQQDRAAGALQRQKAKGPLVQSSFEPRGSCPVAAVEQYFNVVDQLPTRLAVTDTWDAALAQILPGGDLSPMEGLGAAEMVERLDRAEQDGELTLTDEMVLFYECRCDDEMILRMLTSLPPDQRAELWGEESELGVECPRCGRTYLIQRPGLKH